MKSRIRSFRSQRQEKRLLAAGPPPEIAPADWAASLAEPTEFYARCFRYFSFRLPSELLDHRSYFEHESRGFGERAFHAMWFLLFRDLEIERFLEIGVYRGQTLSLASLLQRRQGIQGRIVGISPFAPAGDTVTRYRADVDYYEDTLANFRHFDLPVPELVQSFSTDARSVETIRSGEWDCVYVDGSHDYEVVRADWDACATQIRPGGIVVLDDSGLRTRFKPPRFATKGHPGPSRLAAEIGQPPWVEIMQVGHNRAFQHQV